MKSYKGEELWHFVTSVEHRLLMEASFAAYAVHRREPEFLAMQEIKCRKTA
jgi:hypothetical protein